MGYTNGNYLDAPRIFVTEQNTNHIDIPYLCAYIRCNFPLPYYTAPDNKNDNAHEFLFLPISEEEFHSKKKTFYYGFRFLMTCSDHVILGLISNPELALSSYDLYFEISRVRYYVTGDKNICIDRINDPLFPPRTMTIESKQSEMEYRVVEAMKQILSEFCVYYHNKRI